MTCAAVAEGIEGHYEVHAGLYDSFYEQLFGPNRGMVAEHLFDIINGLDAVKHKKEHVLADIGGGTGDTISRLKELFKKHNPFSVADPVGSLHAILVEPFAPMMEKAKSKTYQPNAMIQQNADEFAADRASNERMSIAGIDVVLCQEMIHHVKDLPAFFRGIYEKLHPGGAFVIVTRPSVTEFPFGPHGHRSWKDSYSIPPEALKPILESEGFTVASHIQPFGIEISDKTWLKMYGAEGGTPVFSNLADPDEHHGGLTPGQREADITELRTKLPAVVRFNDNQMFIVATKQQPSTASATATAAIRV